MRPGNYCNIKIILFECAVGKDETFTCRFNARTGDCTWRSENGFCRNEHAQRAAIIRFTQSGKPMSEITKNKP